MDQLHCIFVLLAALLQRVYCEFFILDGSAFDPKCFDKSLMFLNHTKASIFVIAFNKQEERIFSVFGYDETVKFELYSRTNSKTPQSLVIEASGEGNDVDGFDKSLETKILIHGWQGSTKDPIVQQIKDEYLKQNDFNIIAVDWSEMASNINYFYLTTRIHVVGQKVAELLDYLVTTVGIDSQRIHLIGHSLGAHVSNYASQYAKFRLSRITGLDPAKPLFDRYDAKDRLDASDADFVDVIHSAAGAFGLETAVGHVDFYPNGGGPIQPGCEAFLTQISCSHGRSIELYAESINSELGFWSYPCDSYLQFEANLCTKGSVLMGDPVPKNAMGTYYLRTNSKSPYAMGKLQAENLIRK